MGLIHPDNREYATTGAAGGVNPATHIPATQTSATGPAPNTAGPHRHDILNKLDPSVDSDLSKTAAAHNQHTHKHNVNPALAGGAGAVAGAGLAHHHNTHTPHAAHPGATTAAGHHHNGGLGTAGAAGVGGVGGAGLGHSAGVGHNNAGVVGGSNVQATAGPHSSDMMNRLDPTVDSRTGLRKQI